MCDYRISSFVRNFNSTPFLPDDYENVYDSVTKTNFIHRKYNITDMMTIVDRAINYVTKLGGNRDLADTGMYISSIIMDRIYEAKVSPECSADLANIGNGLRNYQLWPAKFLDSMGDILQSGLVTGTISSFGEYDQCRSIKSPKLENGRHIYGKYCQVEARSIIPKVETHSPQMERIFGANKYIVQLIDLVGKTANLDKILDDAQIVRLLKELLNWVDDDVCFFHIGICIPSSCSSQEIEMVINQIVYPLIELPFRVEYCESHPEIEHTKIESFQWFAIIVIAILVIIVLFATLFHLYLIFVVDSKMHQNEIQLNNSDSNSELNESECSGSKSGTINLCLRLDNPTTKFQPIRSFYQQILLSFSAIENSNRLFDVDKKLSSLNGLQLLFIFFIFISQSFALTVLVTPQLLRNWVDTVPYQMLNSNAYWFVRTHGLWIDGLIFIMGVFAFSAEYNHLQSRNGNFGYFYYLWKRWSPLSAAMFGSLLLIYLIPLFGDGPMWFLNKNWLWPACTSSSSLASSFFYYSNWNSMLSNYTIDDQFYICNPPTWFASASTQLYLLAPIVIIPLYRWPKIGIILASTILLISPLFTLSSWLFTGYPTFLEWTRFISLTELFRSFHQYTSNTLMYVTSLLIGLMTGYMIETKPNIQFGGLIIRKLMWIISITLVIIPFYWNNFFWQFNVDQSNALALAWYVCSKFMFCTGLAYITYMCCTERGGPIRRILTLPQLQSIGKLSINIYLLSILVTMHRITQKRRTYEMFYFQTIQNAMFDFFLTTIFAYFLYLFFDGPVRTLTKIFNDLTWTCDKNKVVQDKKILNHRELCSMDSDHRNFLAFQLSSLRVAEEENVAVDEWAHRFNNAPEVIEFIETSIGSLRPLWKSGEKRFKEIQFKSSKNENESRVAYDEACYRFEKCKSMKKSSKPKELESILELINEAIVKCPFEEDNSSFLGKLYTIRSKVLSENGQIELALIAIDKAIQLDPIVVSNYTNKANLLSQTGQYEEAYQLIQKARNDLDYPRAFEEKNGFTPFYDDMRMMDEIAESYKTRAQLQMTNGSGNEIPISRSIGGSIRLKEFTVDSRLKFDSDGSVKGSRSIKAIKLIEEEQLIFRERLYSVLLLDECRLVKCAYCFHDVANRFLPCKSCNHVVYCSEQCSKYDWNRSHQYDCKLDRFWLNKSKSMGHVFRMLNRIGIRNTLNIIQSAVDDEYDVISYANDTNHLEAYDDDNTENRLKLNQFRAQCKLLSHSDKFGIKYLSYHIGNAIDCVILACLAQQISYSELTRLEIIKLISYCFESVRRVLINSFRWSEENVNNNKMVNVASAYTLIASMFNHSCDPNSEWFIRNGSIYISTKKQVSEGEELTLSYGPSNKCSIKERQTHLLKNYYFLCNCSKCINDSKSVLALQCENCSGPVLIYKEIFEQQRTNNQKCLICLQTMNDTERKSKQLKQSMRQLELYTKLIPSQQLGIDSEYNWNNCELISKLLNQIGQLIYQKSNLWIEAIYVGCRALFHNGLYDECAQFGSIVDSLLPMSGRELLILETSNISRLLECEENDENDEGKEEQHQLQNDLFDSNIEHLIFWTGVFRVAEQPTYYYQMERFHCRLSSLIDLIIDEKEKTKLNIEDNDILIQSEIDMLRNFQHHKQMEWELFQQEHQTLFE